MTTYSGSERRKHPRVRASFIVSYRILNEKDKTDISQLKNVSMGGMLLTTNRKFDVGTHLALEVRLPFDINPMKIVGKVLESKEISKDLLYDTRIGFLAVEEPYKKVIGETVDFYLKRKKG